jgi:hypothetical protein
VSFSGDLEHLPIVDVIQLLHATRKSGILRVKSRKRESSLVFKDGCIVSASHVNKSVRIGTILIERNIITPEILDQALLEQKNAGAGRKPLIITLLDKGAVKEDDAYRGLEHLIEMTIVGMLAWKKGTFIMDVLPGGIADEYRYYPGKMNREINIDAQGVLMDALCAFDEKMRDGGLAEEEIPEDDGTVTATVRDGEGPPLSAAELGLMRLEMERADRAETKKRRHYAAGGVLAMQEEEPVPPEPVVEVPIQYVGKGAVLVGCIVLACSLKGLYDYGQIQPAAAVIPGLEDPPGPVRLYLTHGLLPTLQALVGMYAALAGALYLKMWRGSRKGLEVAVWSGIAFAVASELGNLITSISRASSSPSFMYYLVEFIGFILMTALWTVPLLAAVWFLRRDVFTVSSLLSSHELILKPYRGKAGKQLQI